VHGIVTQQLAIAARVRWSRYQRPERSFRRRIVRARRNHRGFRSRCAISIQADSGPPRPSRSCASTGPSPFVEQELFDGSERFTVVDFLGRLPASPGAAATSGSNARTCSIRSSVFRM
jgi:hypothetical protein